MSSSCNTDTTATLLDATRHANPTQVRAYSRSLVPLGSGSSQETNGYFDVMLLFADLPSPAASPLRLDDAEYESFTAMKEALERQSTAGQSTADLDVGGTGTMGSMESDVNVDGFAVKNLLSEFNVAFKDNLKTKMRHQEAALSHQRRHEKARCKASDTWSIMDCGRVLDLPAGLHFLAVSPDSEEEHLKRGNVSLRRVSSVERHIQRIRAAALRRRA